MIDSLSLSLSFHSKMAEVLFVPLQARTCMFVELVCMELVCIELVCMELVGMELVGMELLTILLIAEKNRK